MADHKIDHADLVVIPEQQLRGSRREMLAAIDEAITGLLALRHLIAGVARVGPSEANSPEVSGGHAHFRMPFGRVGRLFSGKAI